MVQNENVENQQELGQSSNIGKHVSNAEPKPKNSSVSNL